MSGVARAKRLLLVGCLLLSAGACGTSGLSFVRDERVEIVAPKDRAEVRLPLTVVWRVEDFRVTGPTASADPDAGFFGVFVDRAPPAPGRTLAWLARNDRSCMDTLGCPDRAYFAARDAYTTTSTRFTIERVAELVREDEPTRREFHEVVIVLLNGRGERIGESAFSREFQLKR